MSGQGNVKGREELLAALQARLDRVAAIEDASPALGSDALDEARQLAVVLRDDDGDMRARYLLGWLYSYRYRALPGGQRAHDLNTAITMFTPCFIAGAAGLLSAPQPSGADLAIPAANARLQQALQTPEHGLSSAAADLWKRILDAAPVTLPDWATYLSNLGNELRVRSQRTDAQVDLDAAIGAGRAAVEITPAGHSNKAERLNKLGSALRDRFERTGAQADAEAAIATFETAVKAAPGDHPDRAIYLNSLGNALKDRAQLTGVVGRVVCTWFGSSLC
jgi:hypothetical protein